jgi:hypothetical protein
MKQVNKDEIYKELSRFLKGRGMEIKDGNYSQQIQKGCSMLADAVNLTQQGLERAKSEIDKRLEQMRQAIHEKTAPKRPVTAATTEQPPKQSGKAAPQRAAPKARQRTKASAKKRSPSRKS